MRKATRRFYGKTGLDKTDSPKNGGSHRATLFVLYLEIFRFYEKMRLRNPNYFIFIYFFFSLIVFLTEKSRVRRLKNVFWRREAISFFYTTFCVQLLDFTTRYGIILRHGNWEVQYIVLKIALETQDIV